MLWKVFSLPLVAFLIGWKIIPKFYDFGQVSSFHFLSYRFGPKLARVALISMVFGTIYYMANVAYIPALILSAFSGYSIYILFRGQHKYYLQSVIYPIERKPIKWRVG